MRYEVKSDRFYIVDEELGLNIESELGEIEEKAPGTTCYRKDGQLHGPSTFFSESGQVLSKTWYFEGKKVGRLIRYYPNGQVYATLRYVDGKPHSLQEYFYLDGTKKTVISYRDGVYHGETILYWPDGKPKRRCEYKHGEKLNDTFYNEHGQLAQSLS